MRFQALGISRELILRLLLVLEYRRPVAILEGLQPFLELAGVVGECDSIDVPGAGERAAERVLTARTARHIRAIWTCSPYSAMSDQG